MKTNLLNLLSSVAWVAFGGMTFAQGTTSFTYQGRLGDNGQPANGNYDLQFTLFDAATAGNQIGPTVALRSTGVTNGLFTVTLDFGKGVFDGSTRWVEIGVRPGGSTGSFTTLAPRQAVRPAPYAQFAFGGNQGPVGPPGPQGPAGPQGPPGVPWSLNGTAAYYTNGNVGIGISNPAWALDISNYQAVGRLVTGVHQNGSVLELKNIGASPILLGAINFNNSANGYPGQISYTAADAMIFRTAGSERMRINSAGNVGVGTTSPTDRLHVAGNLRVDGQIKLPTTVRYLSLPASSFVLSFPWYDNVWTFSNGSDVAHDIDGHPFSGSFPIALPDGARITQVTISCRDASTTGDITFALQQINITTASVFTMATVQTSGNNGDQVLNMDTITLPVINNASYAYALWVNNTSYSGDVRLNPIRIRYEVTSPLP